MINVILDNTFFEHCMMHRKTVLTVKNVSIVINKHALPN